MSQVIDGNALAEKKRNLIAREVEVFKSQHGHEPGLAVILVGSDPASSVYVRNKKNDCKKVGIKSFDYTLEENTSREKLLSLINELNNDSAVDGILVQLPLPLHLDEEEILFNINPTKDVDGFHPYNMGRLFTGEPTIIPCTPSGVMYMMKEYGVDIIGKEAVVIGRSNIVGKPMALLLMMEHATVTICHSKTVDLGKKVAAADIVVAATGKPEMIKGDWIKEGAVVIDVGISRTEKGLVGDVDYEGACRKASFITPVPGGVGPMTRAMLLQNTLNAARNHVK